MVKSRPEMHPRIMSGLMALVKPWSVLISMAPVTIEGGWLRSGLPHGVMLLSEDHVAAGAIKIWVTWTSTWGYGKIQVQDATEDHVWICGPIAIWLCDDVHTHIVIKGHKNLWPLGQHVGFEGHLSAENMPNSVACTATCGSGALPETGSASRYKVSITTKGNAAAWGLVESWAILECNAVAKTMQIRSGGLTCGHIDTGGQTGT